MKPLNLTAEQVEQVDRWIKQAADARVAAAVQRIVETIVNTVPGFECPGCQWPWPGDNA